MKGKYRVIIRNRRLVFTMDVERNITVIRGDSATGKTTLVNILHNYEEFGTQSGVTLSSSVPCHVLRGDGWEEKLEKWSGSIVFADEGNRFITSAAFAEAIRKSDNYYILITRENLYQLPYSVDAVLQMKKTTSRFKVTYNRAYPYYDRIHSLQNQLETAWGILTEDSNAGNEMFSYIAGRSGIQCISAGGKSNVLREIELRRDKKLIVAADGAAFGAEMDPVYQYEQMHPGRLVLYLPESFEWLIMSSGIVTDDEIREIIKNPPEHIDSCLYFSWERFFTHLLETKTRGIFSQYQKAKLAPYYLQEENVNQLMRAIEQPEVSTSSI